MIEKKHECFCNKEALKWAQYEFVQGVHRLCVETMWDR